MRPGIIEITLASMAALTTAFMHAGSNTTIKILARRDNPEVITLWTNFGMLPLALVPTLFLWVTPTINTMATGYWDWSSRSIGGYCFTDQSQRQMRV